MTSIPDIFETMAYGPAPEAVAPAQAWLEQHGRRFGLFIGGDVDAEPARETFETVNPATGKPLARVTQAIRADVDARCARPARRSPAGGRSAGTGGPATSTPSRARCRSTAGSSPCSSRSTTASRSASRATSTSRWWPGTSTTTPAGRSSWTASCRAAEPVGVVGQIIPWNFPLLMLAWKIAPALAMGNTVVLKPAEFTSLTALLFAELCAEVGLPAGRGEHRHRRRPDRRGAGGRTRTWTRSPSPARPRWAGIIRDATAGSGKKLSLELGGKSPFIVFDDADLDSVVEGVVDAIWFNQGQVCCAGSRILVAGGHRRRLVAKLKARMETLRVGDPLDKAVDIGAIIAPVQLEKIGAWCAGDRTRAPRLWQPSWSCPKEGCFYPPTLFTDVHPAATIAQVEIFGPVVVLMTFRTPAEAVELANNTRYGLAASVWSENINLALDIAPQLKAGTVWINCTNVFDAASGFGGYRESGFGREGGTGGTVGVREVDETGGRNDGQGEETIGRRAVRAAIGRHGSARR